MSCFFVVIKMVNSFKTIHPLFSIYQMKPNDRSFGRKSLHVRNVCECLRSLRVTAGPKWTSGHFVNLRAA